MLAKSESKRLTMLSLFSGLGGLDLGLESAGFSSCGSVEVDSLARASLEVNRADDWHPIGNGDVVQLASILKPRTVGLRRGELDLLAGAPPCQPYSKAAEWKSTSRQGILDSRARTLDATFAIADVLAPKLIVLENVPQFLSGRTSALERVHSFAAQLCKSTGYSYTLQYKTLNANDFGAAQSRRRAFVVLSRVGEIRWPKPAAYLPNAWDAIGDPPSSEVATPARGKWASLLPSIPEGENYLWHTPKGGGVPIFGYRTRYWNFLLKLSKARASWTLAATPGPSTGPFHWDGRPLTTWEQLRLQSFPTDWIVLGSPREQVRQIGNATPPALAEAVGVRLARALGVEHPHRYRYRTRRSPVPVPASVKVGPVPRHFVPRSSPPAPHPGAGLGPAPREVVSQ